MDWAHFRIDYLFIIMPMPDIWFIDKKLHFLFCHLKYYELFNSAHTYYYDPLKMLRHMILACTYLIFVY